VERRFLAQVEHPNIIKIYNFVQHPDRRFGPAEEMLDQLTAAPREVLAAEDGQPRPGLSTLFSLDRDVFGVDTTTWPGPGCGRASVPQVDSSDPAAGVLATATTADPGQLIGQLSSAPLCTVEMRLPRARATPTDDLQPVCPGAAGGDPGPDAPALPNRVGQGGTCGGCCPA
jgi:serine/threonine-protein kinase PknG